MSKPIIKGWGMLEQALDDETNLYRDVTIPSGSFWDHVWLSAYANDDRGYGVVGNLFEIYSGNFKRLQEITSSYPIGEMPAMQKELMVMKLLKEENLEPAKKTIFEDVPTFAKDRGKLILSFEEYALLSHYLSGIRIYMDYRNGFNTIRRKHFIEGEPVKDLVKMYRNPLYAFLWKWDNKFDLGSVEEFGFITYCAIDSHDNTVLPEVLKAEDPTKVLLEEIPNMGISRVIRQNKRKVRSEIKRILSLRGQRDGMCNVNNLRMRLKRERMEQYTNEITDLAGCKTRNYNYRI